MYVLPDFAYRQPIQFILRIWVIKSLYPFRGSQVPWSYHRLKFLQCFFETLDLSFISLLNTQIQSLAFIILKKFPKNRDLNVNLILNKMISMIVLHFLLIVTWKINIHTHFILIYYKYLSWVLKVLSRTFQWYLIFVIALNG